MRPHPILPFFHRSIHGGPSADHMYSPLLGHGAASKPGVLNSRPSAENANGSAAAGPLAGCQQAAALRTAAHLCPVARELADRLCALVAAHVHEFDARGIANTAWAFAKLRYMPDERLPAMLCAEASMKIHDFVAQNLSNLAWALVYLHDRDDGLLTMMSQRVGGCWGIAGGRRHGCFVIC